ncbi:MAG: ribonuclease, Rne/Rng family [Bacillales bacterium]|jgi:ribonuclease G|nr:ribonuclease, Rne/Rng family [Bacillales bacterium]
MESTIIIQRNNKTLMLAKLNKEGKLCQLEIGNEEELTLGSVFVGTVYKYIPNLNGYFINIGKNLQGYLSIKNIPKELGNIHEGKKLLVQIIKEAHHSKAPKLTCDIEINYKSIVYIPYSNKNYFSKKLSKKRRLELENYISTSNRKGFIFRTECEKLTNNEINEFIRVCISKFNDWHSEINNFKYPKLLNKKNKILEALALNSPEGISNIIVGDYEIACLLRDTDYENQVKIESGNEVLFKKYFIEQEIEKLLSREVNLRSGGSIFIDETETLTVIDVNSGSYITNNVGETALLDVNIEAAYEIAHQILLRNIGGIVIIDFINLDNESNKEKLLNVIESAFSSDNNKINILGFTKLNLLELTRERTGKSLSQKMTEICCECNGTGRVQN